MSVTITRRTALRALAGASLAAGAAPGQARRKPNFVFILADDMGYADLGCYGSGRIKTPNIDRLAREGMRFSDCYANAPVCTPTRVGFLTGRYQQRFGKDLEGALGPANNYTAGLRPSESALPSALKRQGYACGTFGKWHVGANEEFRPLQHGFDEYFGILLGNADMYSHKYHSGVLDLWEGNETVEREGYLTEMFGRRAARFIEQNADRPFFCYLPFNAVHWPFQPPERPDDIRTLEDGNWRDGPLDDYIKMTEAMDAAVGVVLDAIDRAGVADNTFVVFTNDNGGERLSDNGPLFHYKATLFEGGIRVPAVARWPGVIPAGSETTQVAVTMDFTRTMLEVAGAADGVSFDGENLLSVLRGEGGPIERSVCWRINTLGRSQMAIRRGRWKYIDDNTGGRGMPELLFDVVADPSERKSLFATNQGVAAELRAELLAWSEEMDAAAARR